MFITDQYYAEEQDQRDAYTAAHTDSLGVEGLTYLGSRHGAPWEFVCDYDASRYGDEPPVWWEHSQTGEILYEVDL